MLGAEKTTDQWSAEARSAVIVETATFSETKVTEYCRKKGLNPEKYLFERWCYAGVCPGNKVVLKRSQKKIKQLEKELLRS